MGRPRKERVQSWMEDLARKNGVSFEAVKSFYDSIDGPGPYFRSKKQRTESFFDLYSEGVKEGN